jgi:hypothetical protein
MMPLHAGILIIKMNYNTTLATHLFIYLINCYIMVIQCLRRCNIENQHLD